MNPEQFIPSYIEVLATLLVLGISLPSILINVPSRMRAIRDKHTKKIYIRNSQIAVTNFFQYPIAVTSVVFSITFLAGFLYPPPQWMCSNEGIGFWCAIRDYFLIRAQFFAFWALVINILMTAFFFVILQSYTKDQLLINLAKQCRRKTNDNNIYIDQTILESIGELGEFCDSGRDKESVLDILSSLSDDDLPLDSWYDLAHTVRETVVGGNERNYIDAMGIIQDIFRLAINKECKESEEKHKAERLAKIMSELEQVMIQAFAMGIPRVTATIMTGYDEQALQEPTAFAHAFLRIGKAALAAHEMSQAVAVLDKFHTKISELLKGKGGESPVDIEAVHIFFGLLAHFWCRNGTAQQHALRYLRGLSDAPNWNMDHVNQLIQQAKMFFSNADMETADYLEQMLYENNQIRFVEEFLSQFEDLTPIKSQRILNRYPSMKALQKASVVDLQSCGIPEELASHINAHINTDYEPKIV